MLKTCPYTGVACNEDRCGLWHHAEKCCAIVSLAQKMADQSLDLYRIRRSMEDNQ